jgi:hypothetical protein
MSTFNTEQFLNQQYDKALDTQLLLPDEGEYLAVTGPVGADNFRSYDIRKGERAGTKGYGLDIDMILQDDTVKAKIGREPKVRWSTMLDMTPDNTALDFGPGKNVRIGQLRKALGQNDNGKPWHFGMLSGQILKVKVKHRVDAQDSSKVYAEVAAVAPAG